MTPDVVGVIVAAGLGGALFGGIWVLLSRQTIRLETRFETRFDRIESEISELRGDISDLKVAVARLEDPAPRLVMPR